MEPDLPAETLNELEAADVRFIHVILDNQGTDQTTVTTYRFE